VSGAGTYSFLLLSDDTNGGHYLSKEGGAATCEQPYLTIVTEPDTGDDVGEPSPDGGAEDGSSPDAADTLDGRDGEVVTDGDDAGRDVVAADDSSLGCGCAVAGAGAAARSGLAVLVGLLLVRLRRRRLHQLLGVRVRTDLRGHHRPELLHLLSGGREHSPIAVARASGSAAVDARAASPSGARSSRRRADDEHARWLPVLARRSVQGTVPAGSGDGGSGVLGGAGRRLPTRRSR